jgi:glycosyltransferase involved in cell wall biosynthesis
LVPERDEKALAAAMARLIRDKSLRDELTRQGRLLVERDYNISRNTSRLGVLFQLVVDMKKAWEVNCNPPAC